MGVWAAATPITRNGADPNFVFRVSAVDELVDKALVHYAMKKYGAKRPGMRLINNPWGESNEKGLTAAIAAAQIETAGIEKFEANDVDMVPPLSRLRAARSEVILLVANAYDAMHLMALAIDKAGSTAGDRIRQGLYAIETYKVARYFPN